MGLRKSTLTKTALRNGYSNCAELGCIICGADAEIHHLTGLQHRAHGKKAEKWIPLCPMHHQHGGYGVAVHAGVKEWEKNFGTQEELWLKTQALPHEKL